MEGSVPETVPVGQAGRSSRPAGVCAGVETCNSPGCLCCVQIRKCIDTFQSTATGTRYNIRQYLTCKTACVIYIIECKKCQVQYVGKTSTTLQRRFGDYRSSINHRQQRPIPVHFNSDNHSLEDLIIFPIEQVTGSDSRKALKEKESYWIRELGALAHGLNLAPYKYGEQPDVPPDGPGEESMASPGKRKFGGKDDRKAKRRKKGPSVFSYETEEHLSTYADALEDGKQTISEIHAKLKGVSCSEEESVRFLKDLKMKVSNLKKNVQKEKIYIGLFGKTGTGKSALINAIVNENELLPSGSMFACTSAFVYVQANPDSSKYKADIEFIRPEDWRSELQYLVDMLRGEDDEMAKEKIRAVYGQEGLDKSYGELVETRGLPTSLLSFTADTAEELSGRIGGYIRSDRRAELQLWPLVKQVTISLPKSPALLEGIVLIDLPGAGDVNKHRNEMWKECLSQCSAVWIVADMNRALSEEVTERIFEESLRHVAGGGECHHITYICTKTDTIVPREIRKDYILKDEDLGIEGDTEDYEKRNKQACILFRNERFKMEISAISKEKAKKFLFGEEVHSDDFFNVFTVSSHEFMDPTVLDPNETELPLLREHIKKLYVSHKRKEVRDYVSEVSGIISYLHFSKDALSLPTQTLNPLEFQRLEKVLKKTCDELESALSGVRENLEKGLRRGAKEAELKCQRNVNKSVLDPNWCDKRGHHKTLKALFRNDGYFRTGKGIVVDMNYALSKPMYKEMNDVFLSTFRTQGGTRTSIHGRFACFREDFIKDDLLKYQKDKKKEMYLRLVFIKTEQRRLCKNLLKETLRRKKLIYDSLSDSVRDSMMPAYQECATMNGTDVLMKMTDKVRRAIEELKNVMFRRAMGNMLAQFSGLQKYLGTQLKTQMMTSLRLALNQIPEDLTGLPDVSEEMETMKRSCESLGLRLFD